jgi:hypothetical protein
VATPSGPADLVRSVDLPAHKGRRIRAAGLVATGRYAYTERGLEMQFITLEDEWGLMEVTVFPGTYPLLSNLGMGPYLVTGVPREWPTAGVATPAAILSATRLSSDHFSP